MKVIAICGSPRSGNTEFILKRILTQSEKFETSVELVLLKDKRIEYCNGCLTCDSTGLCNIRDDMQLIYSKLEESDMIIFGSPTYFDSVTGMMKNFIDRLEPLVVMKKLNGKKVISITVGQENENSTDETTKYIERFSSIIGSDMVGDLSFIAKNLGEIEKDSEKISQIDRFVQNIFT